MNGEVSSEKDRHPKTKTGSRGNQKALRDITAGETGVVWHNLNIALVGL